MTNLEIGILIDATLKILTSIILGGLIGFEREIKHHPAGFRTYILVCLGSTLLMFVSYYPWHSEISGVTAVLDVSRVAAAVVTGIGFLGAGAIFREGVTIKGLTTAAGLWVTAGVGILVGIGLFEIAIISTGAILITLSAFSQLEEWLSIPEERRLLQLRMSDPAGARQVIEDLFRRCGVGFEMEGFLHEGDEITLTYRMDLPRGFQREVLTRRMIEEEKILEMRWK
ncbi:MAG: MgtC/SapB family protein [Candidatus Syntrophoarchaeum sp. WYZ-LMO15]|nr:MAG: MgtC/SapB family protein [Candidatus Syntrophoarchaeum sp. WYZ-LMO15]